MHLKSAKNLHVVSFNVPFPADYGGVIGVFYHLRALQSLGVRIILHCFQYGRAEAQILDDICEEVYYYQRNMSPLNLLSKEPFIVKSRRNDVLLDRLIQMDYPILFEGTHVCAYLGHPGLAERTKIVRMHNVEWHYYDNMVPHENNWFKKIFFKWEARKLRNFELGTIKEHANATLAVSPKDQSYFVQEGFRQVAYVSAFHSNEDIDIKIGKGAFILFHGDLSVKENELNALDIAEALDKCEPKHQFIIAGRRPSDELLSRISVFEHVELKQDVSDEEMEFLFRNAHMHLLRAYQPAGMKLKLLNALYKGRFLMVNSEMVKNTGLDEICIVVDDIKNVPSAVNDVMTRSFGKEEIEVRKKWLDDKFSNIEKAKITLSYL